MSRQTNIPVRPALGGLRLRFLSPAWIIAAGWLSFVRFFVLGRPVTGKRDDNATFLHDATVDYRERPVEKLGRARWRRVARRWAFLGVPGGLVLTEYVGRLVAAAYGVLERTAPAWTGGPYLELLALYACGAVLLAALLGVRALRAWWPTRHVTREYARPTWEVVCRILGEKYRHRDAPRRVQLPAGFGQESTQEDQAEAPELVARLHLPAVPLDEGMKGRIVRNAGERLGITDAVASWTVKGSVAFVDLTPRTFPPRRLTFAEVRELMEKADPRAPFVGLAAGRAAVTADLDNDGPHIGASGGTGTGKSTLMAAVLMQRVRAGAGLIVCDYKVISQPWARRIAQEDPSRVLYFVEVVEIHGALLAVLEEFERRRTLLKEDPAALAHLRDVDVMLEEVNTLADFLRDWWKQEGRREHAEALGISLQEAPGVPPSVTGLKALVQMGRELGIRMHFAAQRLDAAALAPSGGGAVRESITNRFLAKYTRQTWDMLCRGVPYEAFPGGPRGIWTAVVNDTVTHFRVPNIDRGPNGQAYAFAMSGPAPTVSILGGGPVLEGTARRAVTTAVKLADALPRLPRFSNLDALRKAVARAELESIGKDGNALLYDLEELVARWGAEELEGTR